MNWTERYQAGSSPLHRHDARVKVVVALLLIIGIVLTPNEAFFAYPLLWLLVASLSLLGGIGIGRLARMGSLALPFTLAAVTLLFTTPGDTLLSIAGLDVTDTGAIRFIGIVFKSWLAVQVTLLLSMTTPVTDLLWALGSLRVPQPLIVIISFMYRYMFTLQEEAQRLIRARASRSGYQRGLLLWRARVTGNMIGSLFLRSYERSERVYMAMLSRGYRGEIRHLNPPILSRRAVALGAIPVIAMLLIQLLARLIS